MNAPCDHSRILIPNDQQFHSIVAQYVAGVAALIGFDKVDIVAVQKAVSIVLEEALDCRNGTDQKGSLDIASQRIPAGLMLTITDKGQRLQRSAATLETATDAPQRANDPSRRLIELREYVDEIRFHNRRVSGQTISLIKHQKNRPITEYFHACELEPYHRPSTRPSTASTDRDIRVRPMHPSEAIEVSRAIYKSYGDSYPYHYVYYPEKLIELNRAGRIHSAVAVTGDKVIAGHCALHCPDHTDTIAEMAQGVVKPEFRLRGCFAKLTEYLIQKAKKDRLMGIYAQPVTNHTFSQQVGHRCGLRDCALLLSHIPTTISFHGIDKTPKQKISVLVQFRYLDPPKRIVIYAPSHHRQMLMRLYQNLGVTPQWQLPAWSDVQPPQNEARVHVTVKSPLNLAVVEIAQYAADIAARIQSDVAALCQKGIEVVNLYLRLTDPSTYRYIHEFEKLGFFFAGVLPGAVQGDDALILQYLNLGPIDYRQIQLHSETACRLAQYIRHTSDRDDRQR